MSNAVEVLQNGLDHARDYWDGNDIRSLHDIAEPSGDVSEFSDTADNKRGQTGPSYGWLLGAEAIDLSELVEVGIYSEEEALVIADAASYLVESERRAELAKRSRGDGVRKQHRSAEGRYYRRGKDLLAKLFELDLSEPEAEIALTSLAVKLRNEDSVTLASFPAHDTQGDGRWWDGMDGRQRAAGPDS